MDKAKRSKIYCQMGKAYIQGLDWAKGQHCFIRAVQLKRLNADAWCLMALLYFKFEKVFR